MGRTLAIVIAVAATMPPTLLPAVSYDFDLTYDPATAVVAGTQVISFARDELNDRALLVLLNNVGSVPNPYTNPLLEDQLYESGFEPAYTEVTAIVDAAGNPVPYAAVTPTVAARMFTYPIPGLALRLQLPERDRYRLEVTFRTHLPTLRTPDNTSSNGVFVQRFGWYPRFYPDPDKLTLPPVGGYRVRIVVPHGYRVISHAEERAATPEGTAYIIESRVAAASIPLTIFPEEHFRSVESRSASHPVRLFHRPGHERQARKLVRYAAEALDHYATALGPLDYHRVTIVEGVRPGVWGMAADGFVMLGTGAFNADVPFPSVWNRMLEFLVAHEIAHFYFGIGTVTDFIGDNWLSESLTQYVTLDYLEHKYGADDNLFPDTLAAGIIGSVLPYTSFREALVSGFHAVRKAGFDFPVVSEREAQNQNGMTPVIYEKGALAVRQLATEMGKSQFDAALADYFRRFHHRSVDTGTFLTHLEQRRPGMERIGEQVLTTTRYPDYAVERVEHDGGVARITIRDYGDSGLAAPVRVLVDGGDGADRERAFTVRGGAVLEVVGRVREVAIDTDWYTLDTNRKNNYHPRKLNWVVPQHSRHEADLIGIDVRLLDRSPDTLSVGVGAGYWATGWVSYALGTGFASRIGLPEPEDLFTTLPDWEPGAYASLSLALPREARAGAGFTWYREGDWTAELSYRQPLRMPREVGIRPTFYDDGLALAAGLALDQRPDGAAVAESGLRESGGSCPPPRQAAATRDPASGGPPVEAGVEYGAAGAAAHRAARVPGTGRRRRCRLASVRYRNRAVSGGDQSPACGWRRSCRPCSALGPAVRQPRSVIHRAGRPRGSPVEPGGVPQSGGSPLPRSREPLRCLVGARERLGMDASRRHRAERRVHLAV